MADARIEVPGWFVSRARAHAQATGLPLLDHRSAAYRTTIYACAWAPPEFGLQAEPGPETPPYDTWREYAVYRGQSVKDFLEEHPDIDDAELDEAIDDPFALEGALFSVTAGVYYLLERFDAAGEYVCAATGDSLGDVEAVDGPFPGNDYVGVTVSSPLALACLQHRLDELGSGIRIEVGSTASRSAAPNPSA